MPILVTTTNITEYPLTPRTYPPGAMVSIGDLHANILKALHFLLQEGVITLPQEDFEQFVACHKKFSIEHEPELTEEERYQTIMHMSSILKKIKKGTEDTTVRFLGDTLADRGENDYLMFQLYKMLNTLNINFEVLYSNHDAKFIDIFYTLMTSEHEIPEYISAKKLFDPTCPAAQYRSSSNFFNLAAYAQVHHQQDILSEAQDVLNDIYMPHLNIISCEVSENSPFTEIATHAPSQFESVEFLALILREHSNREEVEYDDTTSQALRESCELINSAMRDLLNKYLLTTEPIDPDWIYINGADHSLYDFVWARYTAQHLQQPSPQLYPEKPLFFLHGHDPYSYYINSASLDGVLGKVNAAQFDSGEYRIHHSHAPITPSLRPPGSPVLSSTAVKRQKPDRSGADFSPQKSQKPDA